MGWDSCSDWTTGAKARAAYKAGLVRNGYKIVAQKTAAGGRQLWSVIEKNGNAIIDLGLFESHKENGVTTWSVKSMCESEHPYYYECPAEFLGMAPVANAEWREKVQELVGRTYRVYEAGQVVKVYGKQYRVVGPHPEGGWEVVLMENGRTYRAKPNQIEA